MNNLPVVRSPWRIVILLLGFTFLYAPMLMLVIYSFNSSKLVREEQQVAESIALTDDTLVPFLAGETVRWSVKQ